MGDSKFKVADGQQLNNSNYVLPNDSGEEERLNIQHLIFKHAFNGSFSAPVDQLLKSGARVLDVWLVERCCGSAAWTLELAKKYPNSNFIGIDIAPVVLADEKPSNVEFVEHNVLDGLPFDSNSFDYVFARAAVSVYTRTQWTELAIPEYTRVTKPGGWVELMEFDALRGEDDINIQRVYDAWVILAEPKGLVVSPGSEIRGFLEQSGWLTNIGYVEKSIPIGPKGEKYAEMAIRSFQDVWRGLKIPFSAVMQVTGEQYDAIIEAAVQGLIDKGTTWKNMRVWGQKKDNSV
ncbi:10490_t:CDS:2 [Paraglomus occultum]|uniref:10490_t:CDS:1 n=1 Tax=Paraglomus occultum TaxID=144539 RepID=A0A9N8ZY14_9GLOM|nr:10490_t:CDS:2 [Paraglomus occultum]